MTDVSGEHVAVQPRPSSNGNGLRSKVVIALVSVTLGVAVTLLAAGEWKGSVVTITKAEAKHREMGATCEKERDKVATTARRELREAEADLKRQDDKMLDAVGYIQKQLTAVYRDMPKNGRP